MQTKNMDLTVGSIPKLAIAFSIPIFIGALIQTLFNTADQVVLGQMAGSVAVASVGACSQIVGLIVNFFSGFSGGVTVVLARAVGAKDYARVKRIVSTAMIVALGVGILATCIGESLAVWLLRITNCPEDCFDGALVYLRIYYASIPAITVYNFGAAILRVSGDTRRPMIYLSIGGVLNIVLNVLLCLVLTEKVAAVAIATTASQVLGAILVVRRLCHTEENTRFDFGHLVFDFPSFKKFLRYGIPTALNSSLYNIANLQLYSAINSYGSVATAGHSAAASLAGLISTITSAGGQTTLAMMGQNLGAKKPERVKKTFWFNLILFSVIAEAAGLLMYFLRKPLIAIYLPDLPEALEYAAVYMACITAIYVVNGINSTLTSSLNAFGYSFLVTVCNLVCIFAFRSFWMQVIYPMNETFLMVEICFTISWLLMLVAYTPTFFVVFRRYLKYGKYKKL